MANRLGKYLIKSIFGAEITGDGCQQYDKKIGIYLKGIFWIWVGEEVTLIDYYWGDEMWYNDTF